MKNGVIHHIEIYVSNFRKSKAFWEWFLTQKFEYVITQQWKDGICFKWKDSYLCFVQTEPEFLENEYHRKNTGLNHIAFSCTDKEFILNLEKDLIRKKIPLLYHDKFPHAGGPHNFALFFEDPNRIKVEVVLTD